MPYPGSATGTSVTMCVSGGEKHFCEGGWPSDRI